MPTPRTTLKRLPDRGSHERDELDRILDEGLLAHVSFALDAQPFVIPMAYARDDDRLLLHGSVQSRLQRALGQGIEACVCVTLLDGLVLARSGFHSSMNYRSAIVFGRASLVTEADKVRALDRLVEHLVPGRTRDLRAATRKELDATEVLALPLSEFSVKVRRGPPQDARADRDAPVWGGVLGLRVVPGPAVPDALVPKDMPVPEYLLDYRR